MQEKWKMYLNAQNMQKLLSCNLSAMTVKMISAEEERLNRKSNLPNKPQRDLF